MFSSEKVVITWNLYDVLTLSVQEIPDRSKTTVLGRVFVFENNLRCKRITYTVVNVLQNAIYLPATP